MNELIKITDDLKPLWRRHVEKYHNVIRKVVRKELGFWKYHFTSQGTMGEYIMLNTSFKDKLRRERWE